MVISLYPSSMRRFAADRPEKPAPIIAIDDDRNGGGWVVWGKSVDRLVSCAREA
jgi:hypothetical protein